jgi:hypothetical protein
MKKTPGWSPRPSLPHLDSNQEPIGSETDNVTRIHFGIPTTVERDTIGDLITVDFAGGAR